jgi:putative ATP-dependent endonuclease of OLD family
MRPTQIRVKNFLSYEDSGEIDINNKTIIVGENNAGKSNFVNAIRTFFRFSSRRRQDLNNFYNRNKNKKINITVWFDDLSEEEKEDFSEGLNEPSTGELAVRLISEYNSDDGRAETNDYQQLVNNDSNKWEKKSGLANTLDNHLPDVAHYGAERELDDAAKTSNKSSLLFKLLGSAYDEISEENKKDLEKGREELQKQLRKETPTPIDELVGSLNEKMSNQVKIDGELNIGFDIPGVREMV